jgi:hypothetical protein
MTHSVSVLSAARSMRSGSGRGDIALRSSGMRTVCRKIVAQPLAAAEIMGTACPRFCIGCLTCRACGKPSDVSLALHRHH